jgi:multisubunit Na+/H+ antiporter MnhB subunit
MLFDLNLSPRTLGRVAWIWVIVGGGASFLANLLRAPILGWTGLVLIGVGFVAMCWLGGHALRDLRADEKDDTEAR